MRRGTIKYDHASLKKSSNKFESVPEGPLILRVEGGIADRSSLYRMAVRLPGSEKELNASAPFVCAYQRVEIFGTCMELETAYFNSASCTVRTSKITSPSM